MKWSKTLIPTLRQIPGEAVVPSHQLMLRAGLIQQVASGTYTYLPLGLRVLHKVMNIIRQEMDRAGAVEVFMPALQPVEWWEQTGRRAAYGDNLFIVVDRHKHENVLGPTHEEPTTMLIKNALTSYRQLPITVYQIQTKFRDEFRPRFGVLRSREFQMKDAYSFDLTVEGLNRSYDAMFDAYCRIFTRCGLNFVSVEAESGPIGGSASHEFMVPSPTGEDVILSSDKGNYAANVEKCEIGPRKSDLNGEPKGELTKVHTPNCASINDVGDFMKVKPKNMLKTLVCGSKGNWVIAVVRGDHDLNEGKLRAACGLAIGLADEKEAKEAGFTIGFVGPHVAAGRNDVKIFVDPCAAQPQFWATGANEVDHHVKYFNWKRDVLDHVAAGVVHVADIRNAVEGDPSPKNDGGILKKSQGIEIGHVFKLGTKYTDALGVTVLNEKQEQTKIIMGCYGIGVNRILASALESESGHDDKGILWPAAIAPYHVVITPIKYDGQAKAVADDLYQKLGEAGLDVLLDDRDERPGVKFNDADLIGIPLRITIGDKGLAGGQVEFKPRKAEKAENISLAEVVSRAVKFING